MLSFEQAYDMRDKDGGLGRAANYAAKLAESYSQGLRRATEAAGRTGGEEARASAKSADPEPADVLGGIESAQPNLGDTDTEDVDVDELYRRAAVEHFRNDADAQHWFRDRREAPWMAVQSSLISSLPEGAVADPSSWAVELVPTALNEVFGQHRWRRERRPKVGDPTRNVTWVVLTDN